MRLPSSPTHMARLAQRPQVTKRVVPTRHDMVNMRRRSPTQHAHAVVTGQHTLADGRPVPRQLAPPTRLSLPAHSRILCLGAPPNHPGHLRPPPGAPPAPPRGTSCPPPGQEMPPNRHMNRHRTVIEPPLPPPLAPLAPWGRPPRTRDHAPRRPNTDNHPRTPNPHPQPKHPTRTHRSHAPDLTPTSRYPRSTPPTKVPPRASHEPTPPPPS